MNIWLESIEIPLIEKGARQGLLQGVVTTPALLSQHPKETIKNLLAAQPGPVVVDVYSDFLEIGAMIAALSPRIILRIPAIESAWESIHLLSNVMVGAIFSPVHAMLAARAGALYVCPHLSRMVKTGEKPFEQIESVQKIISNYQFPTQVMVLHPKSLEQVKACAEIGVSGTILRDDLYKELLESHELAAFHTEQSIEEWKKSVVLFSSTH